MVRCFAAVDSRLAISETARKANSATQLFGSAIVNVPTGGKKKKLNVRDAAPDGMSASGNPQKRAMTSTQSRYANPAVVAVPGITRYATNVTTTTPATDINTRRMRPFMPSGSVLFYRRSPLDLSELHPF